MLRTMTSLLLIASLLYGGLMPCCLRAAQAAVPVAAGEGAPAPVVRAESGGHPCGGHAADARDAVPTTPDAAAQHASDVVAHDGCDDCSQCLTRVPPPLSALSALRLAEPGPVAAPTPMLRTLTPQDAPVPLLRPPILHSATAS